MAEPARLRRVVSSATVRRDIAVGAPMHRIYRTFLALILTLASASSAFAFGTINELGQNAEHEKITRRALPDLEPITLGKLAGQRRTFGAVGAPDRIWEAMFKMSAPHCDNGDYLPGGGYPQNAQAAQLTLESCRGWIASNMETAVQSAAVLAHPTAQNTRLNCSFKGKLVAPAGSPKCEVLRRLGLALHASQDFYSHTNWADKADPAKPISPANPNGLSHMGQRAPWLDLHGSPPFPSGLISGCYGGLIEARECNYTDHGIKLQQVKHDYLNKDKGAIDPKTLAPGEGTTSRGKIPGNFASAFNAATEDSVSKWAFFEEQVRARYPQGAETILCAIRRDDFRKCPGA